MHVPRIREHREEIGISTMLRLEAEVNGDREERTVWRK